MALGRIFKDLYGCEPPGTIAEIDEIIAKARPDSKLAKMLTEHKERDARFSREFIRFINS